MFFLFFLLLLSSCHYPRIALDSEELTGRQRDSLACLYKYNYAWNTNLELRTDSVELACLPVKDSYKTLHKGDRVVVAEFAIHPADSVDSVWVKLAHTQEVQGWLRQSDMKRAFAPTDSISQAIYLFSDTHASYFVIVFALFVAVWLFRAFRTWEDARVACAFPQELKIEMREADKLYHLEQNDANSWTLYQVSPTGEYTNPRTLEAKYEAK